MIIVTYLSLTPKGPSMLGLFPHQDKVGHFIFYFVMVLLALWAGTRSVDSRFFFIVAFTIGYGILMEILQKLMELGRHFDYFDILANISGSLIGAAIFYLTTGRK